MTLPISRLLASFFLWSLCLGCLWAGERLEAHLGVPCPLEGVFKRCAKQEGGRASAPLRGVFQPNAVSLPGIGFSNSSPKLRLPRADSSPRAALPPVASECCPPCPWLREVLV